MVVVVVMLALDEELGGWSEAQEDPPARESSLSFLI